MDYINASKASRILGVSKPEVVRMINDGEIKLVQKKGPIYQIPQAEIDRLVKDIERKDAEFIGEKAAKKHAEAAEKEKEIKKGRRGRKKIEKNMVQAQADQKSDSLTITEIADQLGIKKSTILYQIKKGNIYAVKGESLRSPYRIEKSEIAKLEKLVDNIVEKIESKDTSLVESRISAEDKLYQEVISIQKNIAETVNHLAAAQQQLVANFSQLKK